MALRARSSVINSNKSEKKRNFKFGRKDGHVYAGRVLACFGEDKQLLTLDTGNKGVELRVRLLSLYSGVGIKVREEREHKLLNLLDAPLRNEMPHR